MKKLILYLLLIILFSCPASADTSNHPGKSPNPEYVEGEIIVMIYAPAFDDYKDMAAFSKAILLQAEAFASQYELEVRVTIPELAKLDGRSIICLYSKNKSTEELMKVLSSDPDVISVQPNYYSYISPPVEENEGCNAGFDIISLLLFGLVLLEINRKNRSIK